MNDEKKEDELWVEALLGYANGIIATLREQFFVLDKNLRVISANEAFYATFEVTEKDTISSPLSDLGNGIYPAYRRCLIKLYRRRM